MAHGVATTCPEFENLLDHAMFHVNGGVVCHNLGPIDPKSH